MSRQSHPSLVVAALLFCSGMCSLIYQTTWLREFRLIFGGSTAASAAVLAIFMGGLGVGGLVFGPRADRHRSPLGFYALLELGVAASAVLTPLLLELAQRLYFLTGGAFALGPVAGTALRLLLSVAVLGPPTLLMGGTLPAATRAVQTDADVGRRRLALLYGANTLGAVIGVSLATFFLIEVFGHRTTLILAALVNVLVVMVARAVARGLAPPDDLTAPLPGASAGVGTPAPDTAAVPVWLVLVAAGTVGFAFFLMELVWYRMLAPLLGGSTYTFGIILALALVGVGAGGGLYAIFGPGRRATMAGFALTCTLEAACIGVPLFLGDHVAVLALQLRGLSVFGFSGLVIGWIAVVGVVLLPAALVSGYQFPLLIALLGQGRAQVGRQLGMTYAANTAGSILGSLAGGFGLMPLLTAPGVWRGTVLLLVLLGVACMAVSLWRERRPLALALPILGATCALVLQASTGPTAAWRHTPIGAGRARLGARATPQDARRFLSESRGPIAWEAEGIESSVALHGANGWSFMVNGKSDGNIRGDAGTQIMSGLLLAMRHPQPRSALVVGLGTGSSAGWLGAIPSIERVDVVELEPAVQHVAEVCALANRDVMHNPKVHLLVGDGRELLLTTQRSYDVVFSEPSNPYRAGVASLYTQDFYQGVLARLTPDGLFGQWLQAYEVDVRTVRSVLATVASVFPLVEVWSTQASDLLLLAAATERPLDLARLREIIHQEPYRSALRDAWRVTHVEGVVARLIAPAALARQVLDESRDFVNTDDHSLLEFWFPRTLGQRSFRPDQLRRAVLERFGRPAPDAALDWALVEDYAAADPLITGGSAPPERDSDLTSPLTPVIRAYLRGDLTAALTALRRLNRAPRIPLEREILAECLATVGASETLVHIEALRPEQPVEAQALLARLRYQEGHIPEASAALRDAFERYRYDPWPRVILMQRSLGLAVDIARRDPAAGAALMKAIGQPFAVHMLENQRLMALVALSEQVGTKEHCVEILAPMEPFPLWQREFLLYRTRCYRDNNHPLLARAEEDLVELLGSLPQPFFPGQEEVEAADAPDEDATTTSTGTAP